MAETVANSLNSVPEEPELRRNERDPKGVFQKHAKPILYMSAAALVLAAAFFSKSASTTATHQPTKSNQPPQPALVDTTDNNMADLKTTVWVLIMAHAPQHTRALCISIAAGGPKLIRPFE